MSKFLSNIKDLNAFIEAIKECKNDVFLLKNDGSEQFNLKSSLSAYIALGRLADEHGDEYEIFCNSTADESKLLKFFYERDAR